MAPEDIRSVNELLSRDAIVDVCNWVEIAESFYLAAGASLAGTLLRRDALSVISPLPPLAATRHAVAATRGDGSALTVTLGTPDARRRTHALDGNRHVCRGVRDHPLHAGLHDGPAPRTDRRPSRAASRGRRWYWWRRSPVAVAWLASGTAIISRTETALLTGTARIEDFPAVKITGTGD